MSDRGQCKVFSPNIFNPTKCQNCYKPKEGHPSGPLPQAGSKMQRGMSVPVSRDRNTTTVKTLLKEGYLSVGTLGPDGNSVQNWERRWYVLYSSGELEEFPVEEGEVMREKSMGVTVLQDFVRMLDGFSEIGEEHSLGLKALKDGLYLKAANKVDFENWWKELSTFVPSPMKRAYSANAANKPQLGSAKPWLNKTYSSPHVTASKTATTRSPLSVGQSDADSAQVDGLTTKINKLQQEVNKIPKLEEERRKLELEVNYWKEYVTNANSSKRSGGRADSEKALNEARMQIINFQDQVNEGEKEKRTLLTKINEQDKKLVEGNAQLEEANNLINKYIANISDLKVQLAQKKENKINGKDVADGPPSTSDQKSLSLISEERVTGTLSPTSDTSSDRGDASDLETKFINLREKMKRIEKELFLKSKELEKANESRSKVAKYTRTLLQELEAKLNDTQRKMLEASERLSDTTMELEMERERRRRLESERDIQSLSRNSSVSSSLSEQNSIDIPNEMQSDAEVSNRYVDYYRSRFREAEAALLEKDKKLSESQTKYKELEAKYRNVVKQCRSLDDIQVKLSDATHKLSERQLKIHELTKEVEKLRGYERGYDRKSKELQISTDKAKVLEQQLSEFRKKLTVQERELEGFRIREVVMKERLTAFEEESSDEDAEEEEDIDADESRLERSIEAKARVEKTVDLEGQVRLLESENKEMMEKTSQLEDMLKSYEEGAKSREVEVESAASQESESNELQKRVEELAAKLISEEDRYCSSVSELKEKHRNEMDALRTSNRHEMVQYAKLKEDYQRLKECNESKEETVLKDNEEVRKLKQSIAEFKEQIDSKDKKSSELENEVSVRDEKIRNLEEVKEVLNSEVEQKSSTVAELLDKIKDTESILKAKIENAEQLENLHKEKDILLKKLESENAKLRDDLTSMQNEMLAASAKQFAISSDETPGSEAIPDGIPSQDMDTAVADEMKNLRELLMKSQNIKTEYKNQLEETARKYLESEQKVINLAEKLDSRSGIEKELKEEIMAIQLKIEAMRKQLNESQDQLQSKSVELEKERSNISHLVDVTSAYIKELENSLSESREKIDELQNVVEETKCNNGQRLPPEGRSEKDREDSLSDQSDIEVTLKEKEIELERDRLVLENHNLQAKILDLESEISLIKTKFEEEKLYFIELNKGKLREVTSGSDILNGRDGCLSETVLDRPVNDGVIKENQGVENDEKQMVKRVQELQKELEQLRRTHEEEMKVKDDAHAKLIEELREDMERTLADTIKTINSSAVGQNQNTSELEERIRELEKEQEELKIRYEDELDAEKEAHQVEMEETIRDMLTVTEVFKSGKYTEKEDPELFSSASQKSSRRSSVVSTEGLDEMKKEYDKKFTQKERDCEKEVEGIKRDMLTVIEAMQHGGASEAILEITNKNQTLRKEMDSMFAEFEIEREDLKMKIERLESNNFFGLRRNEEMGSKIFQMQTELEDLERKYKLELEVYKSKENSDAILELVKVNEDLEKKIRNLETSLQNSREKHLEEMELLTMKVQEEKRVAISDMTDTVLNLEGIIDEMKEGHEMDIKEFEDRSRDEKLDALEQVQMKIEDMEVLLSQTKEQYDKRLEQLIEEHEKEMQDLREELETKAKYYKTLSEGKQEEGRSVSNVVEETGLQEKYNALESRFREAESAWEHKVEEMNTTFARETETKQQDFNNQISEIRGEYEEKLKSCIKESARRHSVSSRKTESQKNKELSSRVVELELALEEQQKEYIAEIEDYKHIVNNFQALVSELRGGQQSKVDKENENMAEEQAAVLVVHGESRAARVEALESQIQGYEKRIEYYNKKAERDEEGENSRVSELQEEVHDLRKEMKALTERHGKEIENEIKQGTDSNTVLRRRSESTDVSERGSVGRQQKHKRWSDLHLTDMVFTNDGIQQRKTTKEPWKRWSDLHLKQDAIVSKRDEATKSGSVAHRKKLWENPGSGEPRKMRPLSSIRP